MTQQEVIEHWQQGARDALHVAKLCFDDGKYDFALFHCHLAVEKALKAAFMTEHDEEHPYTHDLTYLASLIDLSLSEDHQELLTQLTKCAVESRYSDPYWTEEQATHENAMKWMDRTEQFLSNILS